jgi:FkbM family methyltransferase
VDIKSWLNRKEPVVVIPILDSVLIRILRVSYVTYYLALRLLFRLFLGKEKRDNFFLSKRIKFNYDFDFFPALLELRLLSLIFKFLNIKNNDLIRIRVPKYNFKAFCPLSKNDLINMSVREDELIENFSPNKGDIFIDVGAHIGHYTLISSVCVGQKGKVVAIEADPCNFRILKRNVELNRVDNVLCINAAAYSEKRKVKLYAIHKIGYSIYNTIISQRLTSREFIEVQANTLDELIESAKINPNKINWIKIDVEGAELEVLRGGTNILSQSSDISILIEIHSLAGGVTHYEDIVNLLDSYQIYIQYEKTHVGGEKHIIAKKCKKSSLNY